MTRGELEHAVRAACDVARLSEVVLPDTSTADIVEGVLGEDSPFHRLHGFYAQGLTADDPLLPAGWRERLVLVRNANTRNCSGLCLEPHDLAASKLAAFRDKDRDFIRAMLVEGLISADELRLRLQSLQCDDERRARLQAWLAGTVRDLRPLDTPPT